MVDEILEIVKNNEFFQGGFLVAVMSGILMYLRSIPNRIYSFFNRYTTLSISIPDSSAKFNWMSRYVNDKYDGSNYGSYTVINRKGEVYESVADYRYFKIGNSCWVKFAFKERELESKSGGEDGLAYSMSLKLYGFNKRKNLSNLLLQAKEKYGPKKGQRSILKWRTSGWGHVCNVPDRRLDTVYSDSMEQVMVDLKEFRGKECQYKKRGIPFRRGYLLHGPPGTGKTSSISAIANEFELDIHTINLTSLSGNSLSAALSGDNKLIVFEDIDSVKATNARSKLMVRAPEDKKMHPKEEQMHLELGAKPGASSTESYNDDGIALCELLNAIDGAMTGHNLIFIFTTNHPEKLDPALLRPGRIDKKVLFGYMSQNEFKKMVKVYFDKDCGDCLVRGDLTAAEAQNHYLTHDDYDKFMDFCCTSLQKAAETELVKC